MTDDACDLLCLDLPRAEAVRTRLAASPDADRVASIAQAYADPTRLKIALALAEGGELCVCDLAWVCGIAQNLASHHVRRLRDAGLASSRRDRKLVMYRLTPAGASLLSALTPIPVGATVSGAAAR